MATRCDLPPELWAIVFTQLRNLYHDRHQVKEHAGHAWRRYDGSFYKRCRSQKNFFQLPLVCKRFRRAFERHTDMPGSLYLRDVRQNSIAAFKIWAAAHAADIQLIALADTAADVLIQCLHIIATTAKHLLCMRISVPRDITSLPEFSALQRLQTCTLCGASMHHLLDVRSLGSLTQLETLTLSSAMVSNLRLARNLRALFIHNCNCTFSGACLFMSKLVHLDFQSCVVEQFGKYGLFECTSLQKLMLYECTITGIDVESGPVYQNDVDVGCYIHEDFHEVFQCLDTLEVMIGYGEITDGMMDYDWLFQLTTLTKLSLTVLGDAELECLSQLTGLCELSINGLYSEDDTPSLSLGMRWAHMQCLQYLHIAGLVSFGLGILGLLNIESLRELDFRCEAADQLSTSAFAILLYRLARLRPDIECSIDDNADLLASRISISCDGYEESDPLCDFSDYM